MTEVTTAKATQEKKEKRAYVTLVMKGDSYVPTACACAQALRDSKAQADLVCMITSDVKQTDLLKRVFDHLVVVPYVSFPVLNLSTKQEYYYSSWKSESFTKWQCLNLDYDKIMFIDADLIVLENIDHLFNLQAPAGCFSTPWAYPYAKTGGVYNPYLNKGKEMDNGDTIPYTLASKALDSKSFVVNGGLVLLQPDKSMFKKLIALLEEKKIYGFKNCVSMFDEQAIVDLYIRCKINWTHIHQIYNFFVGKTEWLKQTKEKEKTYHYYGVKPWLWAEDAWDDLKVWHNFVLKCLKKEEIKKCIT